MTSKVLDEALSQEIAKRLKNKAQNSFENAYQAALELKDVLYVQGFLVMPGTPYKPIEHGWLELESSLVDPSLPNLEKSTADLYYFPAQRLTVKQLKAAVEEAQEDYPEDDSLPVYGTEPYEYYGDIMLGGKEYQEAYEQAAEKCRELNRPQRPQTTQSQD